MSVRGEYIKGLLLKTPLVHTSAATIPNVKASPAFVRGPPSEISGAAQVVAIVRLASGRLTADWFPRTTDARPKSVRRAWPFSSIKTFAFEFVGFMVRRGESREIKTRRLTPFRSPCTMLYECRWWRPSTTSHSYNTRRSNKTTTAEANSLTRPIRSAPGCFLTYSVILQCSIQS